MLKLSWIRCLGKVIRIEVHAPLAQLAEQLTLNQWVPGSSPGGCTCCIASGDDCQLRVETGSQLSTRVSPSWNYGYLRQLRGIPDSSEHK